LLEKKQAEENTADAATVMVPSELEPLFSKMQQAVGNYFGQMLFDPSKACISVGDERYVLVRASALSYDFFDRIRTFYADNGEVEADHIAYQMLFDLGHLIGLEDAAVLHKKLNLKNPVEKLSAGPVHFAHTGWAFVEILPDSHPVAGKDYFLHYRHPYSFEADSWIKSKKKAKHPVCIMNAGYSSGWCEASFGISLTAVEISCKAKGDEHCTFIMAPPDQIQRYLKKESRKKTVNQISPRIPGFLARKKMEEELKRSIKEKELLLKEVHHRVKNNLQIMSSLLRLQIGTLENEAAIEKFKESANRINAMAVLHEMLYRSGSLNDIHLPEYLLSLVNYLKSLFHDLRHVEATVEAEMNNPHLNIDKAVSCGLMINEIVSNSFKHAFSSTSSPEIRLKIKEQIHGPFRYSIQVKDNGSGIPHEKMQAENGTFGMQIIHALAGQLDGHINISNQSGTEITIAFN
jgi:two-component sensor histidine kinase/predicted hydrocarbon binding protein